METSPISVPPPEEMAALDPPPEGAAETTAADLPVRSGETRRPLLERLPDWAALVVRHAPVWFLIGIAPGLALASLVMREDKLLAKNQLSTLARYQMLGFALASLVCVSVGYALLYRRAHRRTPERAVHELLRDCEGALLGLLAAPFLVRLLQPSLLAGHPFLTLVLTLVTTAILGWWGYAVARREASTWSERTRAILARTGLGMLMLGYAAAFIRFALADHYNLSTNAFDLGIYDNLVWNTSHGHFLDSSLVKGGDHSSAHFDPILGLVSLPYRLWPRAETLQVLQTLWLCSGAIPLWLLVREKLKQELLATLFVAVYLLHPALHGANLFDFHSLTLIQPFLFWAVYLLDVGAVRRYFVVLAFLLACREDVSLSACFLGLYAILSGRARTGLLTIGLSLCYLAVVKRFAMPDSGLIMSGKDSYSYAHFFAEMIPHPGEGARGLVTSLVTNPLFVIDLYLQADKVLFFATMLVPLLCLPLMAGKKRILLVYGFLFLGLATRKPVYSTHFQYTSVFLPMLMVALPEAYRRLVDSVKLRAIGVEPRKLGMGLAAGLLTASVLVSVQQGAIVPNTEFRTGFTRLERTITQETRERYENLRELIEVVGPTAPVSASESLVPHVSNRREVYRFPEFAEADFVLVKLAGLKEKKKLDDAVRAGDFKLLEREDGMALYQRVE